MLLVGGGRVLHLKESGAGQLGALAAVGVATLVHRAVKERTYFGRHHLNSPEGGSFDVAAAGACFVEVLAFVASETACAQYHSLWF